MAFFTYPVFFDCGSFPFIANNLCSFAVSFPFIRASAACGDVIVGLIREDNGSIRVVSVFTVDEILPWSVYSEYTHISGVLPGRIPRNILDHGDAIYPVNTSVPLPSWAGRCKADYISDVKKGRNVLLSRNFYYFGRGDKIRIILPAALNVLFPVVGFRKRANYSFLSEFMSFFQHELDVAGICASGKYGTPLHIPQIEGFDFIMSCSTLNAGDDGCGAYVQGRVSIDDLRDYVRVNDNLTESF